MELLHLMEAHALPVVLYGMTCVLLALVRAWQRKEIDWIAAAQGALGIVALIAGYLCYNRSAGGVYTSVASVGLLLAVYAFRYFLSRKFVMAGVMMLLGVVVFIQGLVILRLMVFAAGG